VQKRNEIASIFVPFMLIFTRFQRDAFAGEIKVCNFRSYRCKEEAVNVFATKYLDGKVK